MARTTGRGSLRIVSVFAVCAGLCTQSRIASAQRDDDGLLVRRSSDAGVVTFVTAADGGALPLGSMSAGRRAEPRHVLAAYSRLFGITDPERQLALSRSHRDPLGLAHTSFRQMHEGVPVFSGVLRVHHDENRRPYAINGRFYPLGKDVPSVPVVGVDEAVRRALDGLEVVQPEVARKELTVVDPGWYGDPPLGARLAWHVVVHDDAAGIHEACFVDAISGKVLDRWMEIYTARDRRIHDANVTGALPGPLVRAEGDPSAPGDEANLAYDYAADTYGYFERAFGRDSVDANGMPLVVTVNSVAVTCPNAFWTDRLNQAGFCPGSVADDILAHELTHAITSRTAALLYQNQPGQLNESFSDVFGELVDLFNGNEAFLDLAPDDAWVQHDSGPGSDLPNVRRGSTCNYDPDYPEGFRWMLGEDAVSFGGAVRDMWSPACYGMPDRANHPYQICQTYDNGGIHTGSSVPNHAFALATDGAEFNGLTIVGVGPIKSGAVWYRALTEYVSPADNFEDAYYALNQAALDLIGTHPNDPRTGAQSDSEFTAFDAEQIDLALRATEMNTPGRCGYAPSVLDLGPAPACPNKTAVYDDDFESGAPDWTWQSVAPLTSYDWSLVSDLPNERGGTAFFAADPPIGDCYNQVEAGLHALISPVISLPDSVQKPLLQFTHFVATETGFDGGNIKIRVNGGDWTPVRGGDFLFNPYNSMLRTASEGSNSPLAGQEAWTHAGGDWAASVVDLSRFVTGGDRLQLRFEFGKDGCDGVKGWYIDDVEIYLCPDCNRNDVSDEQEARVFFVSESLPYIGAGHPAAVHLSRLLPALGDVTLTVSAIADLGSIREEFDVSLNGSPLGTLFDYDLGRDCPSEADKDSLLIPAELFNQLTGGRADNIVELLPTSEMDHQLCGANTHARVMFTYVPVRRDVNGNQIPDECENCDTAPMPALEAGGVPKNRYLTVAPGGELGRLTALQISVGRVVGADGLPATILWVDRPWAERPSAVGLPTAYARLSCVPVFLDWTGYSKVHIADRAIVPGQVYGIRSLDVACLGPESDAPSLIDSPYLSGRLGLRTAARFGDLVGRGAQLLPDSAATALDIAAAVDILLEKPDAIAIERGDLFPADPDATVDIIDVSYVVDAVLGHAYPDSGQHECP